MLKVPSSNPGALVHINIVKESPDKPVPRCFSPAMYSSSSLEKKSPGTGELLTYCHSRENGNPKKIIGIASSFFTH